MKKAERRFGFASVARRDFTLIELLVVIAIIAILAAILLPTLQGARLRAQASDCQSNLNQMGKAFSSYQQDNEDFFPQTGSAEDWLRGNSTGWPAETIKPINAPIVQYILGSGDREDNATNNEALYRLTTCHAGRAAFKGEKYKTYGSSYGLTLAVIAGKFANSTPKVNRVQQTSSAMLMRCYLHPHTSFAAASHSGDPNERKANFLFVDGHVDTDNITGFNGNGGEGDLNWGKWGDWGFREKRGGISTQYYAWSGK